MVTGDNDQRIRIPGLENNKPLNARFAQIHVSEFDMKNPMFICHVNNKHNRFNLFVHGIYIKNEDNEKERIASMIMVEHLERGERVDMFMAKASLRAKHYFSFRYHRKTDLDFKPEFFMTSKKMDWDVLTRELSKAIDSHRISKYILPDDWKF